MSPLIPILIAIAAWGAWGVCDKMAVKALHPAAVQLVASVAGAALAPVYYLVLRASGERVAFSAAGLGWSVLGAACTGVASLAFIYALRLRDASVVAGLTSAYPAVTLLLGVALLGESISPAKAGGLALVVIGCFILGSSH